MLVRERRHAHTEVARVLHQADEVLGVVDARWMADPLQLADRLPELPLHRLVLRREELEGEGRRGRADELADGRLSTGHQGRKAKRHTPTLAGHPVPAWDRPSGWLAARSSPSRRHF